MFGAIDDLSLALGVASPKDKHEVFTLGGKMTDDGISESLPSFALVRTGLMGSDGERGVEQQHALLGPTTEGACRGKGTTQVILDFLEDVDQRRGHLDAVLHREAEAFCLSGFMIGILANDDDLYLVERAEVESIEYLLTGRIAGHGGVFAVDKLRELLEIGGIKLRLKPLRPRGFYLYVHGCKFTKFCAEKLRHQQ